MHEVAEASAPPADVTALLEIIPDPAYFIDPAGITRYANQAARDRWVSTLAVGVDVRAQHGDLALFYPDGRPLPFTESAFYRAAHRGETVQGMALRVQPPDTEPRHVQVSAQPVRDGGILRGVVLIVRPEADTWQAELARRASALQALNDLAARLLGLNTAQEVYEVALDGTLAIVGAEQGGIALADDARRVFHLVAQRGYTPEAQASIEGFSFDIPGAHNRVRETGEIAVLHVEQAQPRGHAIMSAAAIQTAVMLPLQRGGQVIGVLTYLMTAHRPPTPAERELLRTAATYIGAALDRAWLYERAEAERARLARILEELPVGVYIAESEAGSRALRRTLTNRVAQDHFGPPTLPHGPTNAMWTAYHADGRPFVAEELPLERTLWTGTAAPTQELFLRYQTGEERVLLKAAALVSEDQGVRQAVVVSQDITERKRLEAQVRAQAAALYSEYERLATLVASVNIALATTDAAGRFTLVNAAFERLSGYRREEMVGHTAAEFFAGRYAGAIQALITQVLNSGESALLGEYAYQPPRSDDSAYVDASILPVHGPDGTVTGALCVALDVTEKVRARQEVEDQRALLETIIESAPVGIVVYDTAMHIVRMNAEQAHLARTTPGAVRGRQLYELSDMPAERRTVHQRALAGENVDLDSAPYQYGEGDVRYYDLRYRPVRDPAGHVAGLVLTTVDVTDKVRARDEIENQRALLQTIVENAPVGIAYFDQQMRFVNFNSAWLHMTGLLAAALQGRTFYEVLPATDESRIAHDLVLGGETLDLENIPYTHPDSTLHYYDLRYRPVRDADGAVTGLLTTAVDVTDKMHSRQAIEDQRALLETIVAGTPVGLAFFDRRLVCVNLNAAWADLMSCDLATARGRPIYDLVQEARALQPIYERVLTGVAVDTPGTAYQRPGEARTRYYDLHYRPVLDAEGEITGMLVAVVDVTARQELDQQKDEFLALASHELKTPITAIKGYAQTGLRSLALADTARLDRTLRVINEQSDRLTRLINELLDISRLDNGSLSLYEEPMDLGSLVREVTTNLELTAPGFEFTVDLAPIPQIVNADAQRIEQVITNLVQNAIKYSGDSRHIEVRVTPADGEVITSVRDFGVGIPADQQDQVFGRFFRARNVSARHYSGLGLGLFIAHGIITRHGGRMWLTSAEGAGSTFYFALPLARNEG